jgi:hypothetical protein
MGDLFSMDSKFLLVVLALAASYTALVTFILLWRRYRRGDRPSITRQEMTRLFPILLTALAAMVGLASGVLAIPSETRLTQTDIQATTVSALQTAVAQLRSEVAAWKTTPAVTGSINEADLRFLQATVRANSEAISDFGDLVLTEPQQLLTIPILQRDMVGIRDEVAALDTQVGTLRDLLVETAAQNRWVIGTLALGLLALIVPVARSMLAGPSRKDEKEE